MRRDEGPLPDRQSVITLRHGRLSLGLHELRGPLDESLVDAPRLLLLHGLGEATQQQLAPEVTEHWPGSIWGLDFCGHGASDIAVGGGYSCEILMADVDTALRHLGPCALLGSGLGGYVALLIAGAAPERVRGVIVQGGPGLAGGGVRPGSETIMVPASIGFGGTPDPFAMMELAIDVRPPNYVSSFVRQYVGATSVESAVHICTAARPAWLAAVVEEYGVIESTLTEALDALSGQLL